MKASHLSGRGLVRVGGAEARAFLQGLVTGNVLTLGADEARWAALLTPQGKILFDFLMMVAKSEINGQDAILLDVKHEKIPELIKRLSMYKLRAKVDIADVSDRFGVIALYGGPVAEGARDGRHPDMGTRLVAPAADIPALMPTFGGDAGVEDYDAHRIALGVPEGGVDFKKGCFVGQEVVARMQYRGLTRNRVMKVFLEGARPAPGAVVMAGDIRIGVMGSSAGARGLALLRLDRAEEAAQAGQTLVSGETRLRLT